MMKQTRLPASVGRSEQKSHDSSLALQQRPSFSEAQETGSRQKGHELALIVGSGLHTGRTQSCVDSPFHWRNCLLVVIVCGVCDICASLGSKCCPHMDINFNAVQHKSYLIVHDSLNCSDFPLYPEP